MDGNTRKLNLKTKGNIYNVINTLKHITGLY